MSLGLASEIVSIYLKVVCFLKLYSTLSSMMLQLPALPAIEICRKLEMVASGTYKVHNKGHTFQNTRSNRWARDELDQIIFGKQNIGSPIIAENWQSANYRSPAEVDCF